jgi:hypothetical protein
MRLVHGDRLPDDARREALARFVHRYLGRKVWPTDAEWLAGHAFYVTKSGRLSRSHHHCEPAFMAEAV